MQASALRITAGIAPSPQSTYGVLLTSSLNSGLTELTVWRSTGRSSIAVWLCDKNPSVTRAHSDPGAGPIWPLPVSSDRAVNGTRDLDYGCGPQGAAWSSFTS